MKLNHFTKILILSFLDIIIDCVCLLAGYFIQDKGLCMEILITVLIVSVVKIFIAMLFGLYKRLIAHYSIVDAVTFSAFIIVTNLIFFTASLIFDAIPYIHILTIGLVSAAEILGINGIRTISRIINYINGYKKDGIKTMIIGAGAAGKIAFDEISTNESFNNHVVCFLDEDESKKGTKYLGKNVYLLKDASEIIKKYDIKEAIIAIASLQKSKLNEIIELFKDENIKIKRLPLLTEMELNAKMSIREVSLAELLGRDEITFNTDEIKNFISGRRVLVTGAGGSIGSELVRQVFSYQPKELVLFDIYENSTYDIEQELVRKIRNENLDIKLTAIIGSTYNETRVEEIFKKYQPEIIFHAAAYKHVPLMETSPQEAIRTNVYGTYNVAKMADKYHAIKMVLVSTDKAVRPTNTMGATKNFAEKIIKYFAANSKTSYSAVRFGNVLGSNGSVIPLFKKQIAEGGPVTVTHPDIIRYFMTIPEAVSLILQSATYATGGEIFILDMGKPVKILTLAENVIKQSGYVPYKDIEIIFTGLRPGEKLFEELLINTNDHIKTANSKIFIERKVEMTDVPTALDKLKVVFEMNDPEEIKTELKKYVTDFTNYEDFNKDHPIEK